jgi:site-specific recombinase XerD
MDYLKHYRKMIRLRGLTEHTVKSYCTYISAYLDFISNKYNKTPNQITWSQKREFIDWIQRKRGLSDRTINVAISQLRFFTLYVLNKPWEKHQLPIRKFNTYMPQVPSKEEVYQFISTLENLKVKAMVSLMYSAGLRKGEVSNLKYGDIQRKNMRIHVIHGKNRSDRYAVLSKTTLEILTDYWHTHGRPKDWLFPKQTDPSKPIDQFYLNRCIHAHEEKLGWKQHYNCHSYRHAFGTHLYEDGVDLLTIKELLGHKSLHSTTIYVHLATNKFHEIKNPLDSLFENS